MATLTAATIIRREARKAVKAHYAAKGIRLEESQARFIWSIGLSTDEYTAIREALALGQPHKPVVRARTARKATTQVTVTGRKVLQGWEKAANSTSDDYRSHIAKPGGRSAWVGTDGTFYAVTYAGHHNFSMKCHKAGVVKGELHYGSAVGMLEDKGWVHISGGAIVNRRVNERVTPEQVDTLMAWGRTDSKAAAEVRYFLAG